MTRRSVLIRLASAITFLLGTTVPALAQTTGMFVQMSDTHVGKPATYETVEKMATHKEKVTRIIDEINAVIRPDFVLITGDTISVTDEESAKEFAALLKRFAVPVYVVPGNHDDGSVRSGWFQKYVGPTRIVIDRKPWYVVAFDGRPLMENENPGELLGWIGTELTKPRESGRALVVASHYRCISRTVGRTPNRRARSSS
ncbi:MAG: metallophosphoesterase [Akkermansiaceae bacterium]|nr:metallophosphoesterase [Armatimonadota bacterium]